jgi:hypothetical protein
VSAGLNRSEAVTTASLPSTLCRNVLFDDDAINVQGFSWCLEEPKTIGLSSLVGNILCRSHNSKLSELDSAALESFNAFRESVRLSDIRRGIIADYLTVKRFVIDGPLLERWFLKTLINLSIGGKWVVGDGGSAGAPSTNLVEIAFGKRQFEYGAGLYIVGRSGEAVDSMDRVALTPRTFGETLVAGTFNFRGYRFYLNLLPGKVEMDGESHLFYRDAQMKYQVPNRKGRLLLSHEIKFRWKTRPSTLLPSNSPAY